MKALVEIIKMSIMFNAAVVTELWNNNHYFKSIMMVLLSIVIIPVIIVRSVIFYALLKRAWK